MRRALGWLEESVGAGVTRYGCECSCGCDDVSEPLAGIEATDGLCWECAQGVHADDPSLYGEEMDGFNMTPRNPDGTVLSA